jgi:hypothetical protein
MTVSLILAAILVGGLLGAYAHYFAVIAASAAIVPISLASGFFLGSSGWEILATTIVALSLLQFSFLIGASLRPEFGGEKFDRLDPASASPQGRSSFSRQKKKLGALRTHRVISRAASRGSLLLNKKKAGRRRATAFAWALRKRFGHRPNFKPGTA